MNAMRVPTMVSFAGLDDLMLVPGSLQRVRQMKALREQGWSLEEIATRYAVSRERVRQILRAYGGPDAQEIADARRRRAAQLAEARIDELLALWRGGADAGAVAVKLGLQAAACRSTIGRFATEVDRAARRASLADARGGRTYSDRDIVRAVRSASERLRRVPSAKDYAAVARETELPSLATVLNRMGGWSSAVAAAGLGPAATPRPRLRRWTEDACWEALTRVAVELGKIPSVLAYERFAADRGDLPSSATIRNRLGRWSSLATRLAAQRELTEQTQTRAVTAASALVGV